MPTQKAQTVHTDTVRPLNDMKPFWNSLAMLKQVLHKQTKWTPVKEIYSRQMQISIYLYLFVCDPSRIYVL